MSTDRNDPNQPADHGSGDEFGIGPAGVPFPSEREWLTMPPPNGSDTGKGFVQRTMRALHEEGLANTGAREPLRREVLAAFRSPDPTPDFVERTMTALRKGRSDGFRDLLARHAAPEPSPQFVARTLAALDVDRSVPRAASGTRRAPWWFSTRAWPLVAVAAGALLWFALRTPGAPPIDRTPTFAPQVTSAFAYDYAPTRLPALLVSASRRANPDSLPSSGVDPAWMFVGDTR